MVRAALRIDLDDDAGANCGGGRTSSEDLSRSLISSTFVEASKAHSDALITCFETQKLRFRLVCSLTGAPEPERPSSPRRLGSIKVLEIANRP